MELSYWVDSTEPTAYPRLSAAGSPTAVDVAVVGGGIAGICAAWELAHQGRRVALVEAGRIVTGTTGSTTGKLTSLHTMAYRRLRAALGGRAAELYAHAQQDALVRVCEIVEALNIECDLEIAPAYTYATSAQLADTLREEAAAAAAAGLSARYVTDSPLPFPISGAVRVDEQAQFHPRRYLLALAGEIVRLGGHVFEESRVTRVEPGRITTADGAELAAADIVLATGFPILNRLSLVTRLHPRTELVVAAAVAPEQDPGGMFLTPQQNVRSVRGTPYGDRRLLLITGEPARPGAGESTTERFDRLLGWARHHFGIEEIAYGWAAQDLSTTDGMPYVGPLPGEDRIWVATGFGGWGMTNGVMSGRLLAALIARRDVPEWAPLFDPDRLHPLTEAKSLLSGALAVTEHLIVDRLSGGTPLDRLEPGHGAVVRVGGERHAVYRAEDGTLTSVTATCSHMGCVVGFNDLARSWDCPCHGSRFAVTGEVLRGPATAPLRATTLPPTG